MTAGLPASLHRDGRPVTGLYPGWQAGTCLPAPGGMKVLTLHHAQTGQDACWWLSDSSALLACHGLSLPHHWREQAILALDPALRTLSATLLDGEAPLPEIKELEQEGFPQLRALPPTARIQMLSLWLQAGRSGIGVITPAALLEKTREHEAIAGTGNAPSQGDGDTLASFSFSVLGKLFATRPSDLHTLAPSPFSGRTLRAELTMTMEKGVACRFSDEGKNGRYPCFYLFWPKAAGQSATERAGTPFLYYPSGNLLVGEGPLTPLLPVFLLSWFISNPGCIETLEAMKPFRLADYGVGNASALWANLSPQQVASGIDSREETRQMLSSFPFSSIFRSPATFGKRPLPSHTAMDDRKPPRHDTIPRPQAPSSP